MAALARRVHAVEQQVNRRQVSANAKARSKGSNVRNNERKRDRRATKGVNHNSAEQHYDLGALMT
jgi:hypothetical protein